MNFKIVLCAMLFVNQIALAKCNTSKSNVQDPNAFVEMLQQKYCGNCFIDSANNKIITQKDIPYVVTKPGLYKLGEDVCYTGNVAAISVNTSGVVIDLQDYTIDLLGKGKQGILVENVSDVVIKNGDINNSALDPVPPFIFPNFREAYAQAASPCAIKAIAVSSFQVINITVNSCLFGIAAINLKTPGDIFITDCEFYKIGKIVSPGFVGVGVEILGNDNPLPFILDEVNRTSDVSVTNSIFQSEVQEAGCRVSYCNGVNIEECTITSALATTADSHDGIRLYNISSGSIKGCESRHTAHGVNVLFGRGIVIENCVCSDSNHGGFELGGVVDGVVKNCQSLQGEATTAFDRTFTQGINILGSLSKNILVIDCYASGHTNPNQTIAPEFGTGFQVRDNATNVSFVNCVAIGNNIGFINQAGDSATFNTRTFYKNIAQGNVVANYAGRIGTTVIPNGIPNVFVDNGSLTPINPFANISHT